MQKRPLHQVLLLGIAAILAAFALQGYYLWQAFQLRDQEFNDHAEMALMRVAESFEELNQSTLPDVDLISRVSNNYYVVNLNAVIQPGDLEFLLRREFERVGLLEDFEYGIYDCYTDQMVYGDFVGYGSPRDSLEVTPADMPTHDAYTYYFGVRFPGRRATLLASLGTIGALGAVLLVTIAFFAYASWVLVRQQQLSEMQKDFINNMTHEFKTPLSTIKLASGVLARAPQVQSDERLARYAGIIESQNDRLTSQVEKVLQLAKLERSRFRLQLEPVHLEELIQETIVATRAKVEELGGRFSLDIQTDLQEVPLDRLHFSGALAALLDNALKYSPGLPEIRVSTTTIASATRICIEDKGLGIPEEHHSRIFEKFYRVPTGNIHDVKGFGLGLYYVKEVCEAHGFRLSLDPDRSVGAAFNIDLPAQSLEIGFWQKLKARIFGPDKQPEWIHA